MITSAGSDRRPAVLAASAFAALLVVVATASWAGATAYRYVAPADALLKADVVVLGTVLDVRASAEGDLVWTAVTLGVDRELGRPDPGSGAEPDPTQDEERQGAGRELELRFLGGAPAGEAPLFVAGMPSFEAGDRVLAALYLDDALASPVVGFDQGLWYLDGFGAQGGDGRYLGLVPAATGSADVISLADAPTDLDRLIPALEQLLAGDLSLAGSPRTIEDDAGEEPTAEPEELDEAAGEGEEPLADALPPLTARYRVDDFGGPLLLSDEVAAAAAAWTALAPTQIELARSDEADAVFAYGEADAFDEDTLALTLVRAGTTRTLIAPHAGELLGAALRHELGLVLGLPETDAGGSLPRVVAAGDALGPAQLAALSALARLVPGDIDGDGRVDLFDLIALASRYGRSGLNESADLDGDGVVGDADLEALRELYEFRPPGTTEP